MVLLLICHKAASIKVMVIIHYLLEIVLIPENR